MGILIKDYICLIIVTCECIRIIFREYIACMFGKLTKDEFSTNCFIIYDVYYTYLNILIKLDDIPCEATLIFFKEFYDLVG